MSDCNEWLLQLDMASGRRSKAPLANRATCWIFTVTHNSGVLVKLGTGQNNLTQRTRRRFLHMAQHIFNCLGKTFTSKPIQKTVHVAMLTGFANLFSIHHHWLGNLIVKRTELITSNEVIPRKNGKQRHNFGFQIGKMSFTVSKLIQRTIQHTVARFPFD
ncbi:hypothetical protein T4B_9357 [Trichinella pseudospiralis]|uniref:Uncharacterized protein n=1 Tax=Trichinella pseudospiralis TaxID=6337 RepID=A0A0V1JQJ3_TRIPS|nr:hypothetical protein T4B_9357 [Trichinella pseudospiralis]KRZ37206.1 hypothetical protein T4C_13407 [Trichinella pseudospiralis]